MRKRIHMWAIATSVIFGATATIAGAEEAPQVPEGDTPVVEVTIPSEAWPFTQYALEHSFPQILSYTAAHFVTELREDVEEWAGAYWLAQEPDVLTDGSRRFTLGCRPLSGPHACHSAELFVDTLMKEVCTNFAAMPPWPPYRQDLVERIKGLESRKQPDLSHLEPGKLFSQMAEDQIRLSELGVELAGCEARLALLQKQLAARQQETQVSLSKRQTILREQVSGLAGLRDSVSQRVDIGTDTARNLADLQLRLRQAEMELEEFATGTPSSDAVTTHLLQMLVDADANRADLKAQHEFLVNRLEQLESEYAVRGEIGTLEQRVENGPIVLMDKYTGWPPPELPVKEVTIRQLLTDAELEQIKAGSAPEDGE